MTEKPISLLLDVSRKTLPFNLFLCHASHEGAEYIPTYTHRSFVFVSCIVGQAIATVAVVHV